VAVALGIVVLLLLSAGGFGLLFSAGRVVTRAQYERLREGMSYSEAVRVIGRDGEELSSSHFEGVPGIVPNISTQMYMWHTADGSNMNAIFQNDRMVIKAQFGLR
jgi:hypothetical protein